MLYRIQFSSSFTLIILVVNAVAFHDYWINLTVGSITTVYELDLRVVL